MSENRNDNPQATEERTLTAQTKIYYDVHVPDAARTSPQPLLIALHGYGASKRQMMREAKRVAPENFVIAAVQGAHQHLREPRAPGEPLRFGFGWLTNFHPEESVRLHHEAVRGVIEELNGEKLIDAQRVFLLGFSQSVALNYRFAFTHTELLRGIIGICGGLPGDWETSDLYRKTDASVLHLRGTRDESYPPERVKDYEARLKTRAQNVQVLDFDAGHEITDEMRVTVKDWLTCWR